MTSPERRYVVLFRGVGGATQLPVARLRAVLAEAGFGDVATYINTGNAVLTSSGSADDVAGRVTALVRERMGFEKDVLVAGAAEWSELVGENPFRRESAEPTKLHAILMERSPDAERIAALEAKATGTERFAIRGRVLYLHTPDGMGTSRFAPKIEPTLRMPMTARNWRTVLALAGMMDVA